MKLLNKMLYGSLLGLFGLAFFVMLLEPYTDAGFVEPVSVVLLTLLLFFVFRFIFRKLKNFSAVQTKKLVLLNFIIFIIFQIIAVSVVRLQVFGDPWHTATQALQLTEGSHVWDEWVQYYPNLIPFMSLQIVLIKLSSLFHLSYYVFFYGFNILINSLIWLMVVRILGRKKLAFAAFASIFMLILPMNYDFILRIGYTDGIAILMLLLLASQFQMLLTNRVFKKRQYLSLALIFMLAYLARPNVIVVFVALIIFALIAFFDKVNYGNLWQSLGKYFLACLIGMVLAFGVTRGLAKAVNYDMNNPNVFPTSNWFYESVNFSSMGEWTTADRDYILYHPGYETAKEAANAGIVQRVSELAAAPWKIPVLYITKFSSLWSCGTFATGTDYQLYSYVYHWAKAPAFLIEHIGAINLFFESYAKALMALLLLAIFLRLKQEKKAPVNLFTFAILIIMGISLFHTFLWEVKPRYQFMTIGLLAVSGILSLESLFSLESVPFLPKRMANLGKKKMVVILSFLSVLSLGLMATVMRMQPKQTIVVNAQFQPLNNYNLDKGFVSLKPGQKISQIVNLNTEADLLNVTTANSTELELRVEKKVNQKWLSVLTASVAAGTTDYLVQQSFEAGQYRIVYDNQTAKTQKVGAMTETAVLDYPTHAEFDGKEVSLGFQFTKIQAEYKYSTGLIALFALLYLLLIGIYYKTH
ncbi:MAG: hypothetical protein ACI31W_02890 [Lactococcus sp.]